MGEEREKTEYGRGLIEVTEEVELMEKGSDYLLLDVSSPKVSEKQSKYKSQKDVRTLPLVLSLGSTRMRGDEMKKVNEDSTREDFFLAKKEKKEKVVECMYP